MAVWKQLILCLVVAVVAAALWIGLVPSAPQTLASWGLNIPALAATEPAGQSGSAQQAGGEQRADRGGRGVSVIAQPVSRETINDRLTAIGTGRSLRSVAVLPFVSGRLTSIEIQSGDEVAAGDVIARLDEEAEQIAVDRARNALTTATNGLERAQALRNTVSAVALQEAESASEIAQLALREAELALERRSILAPIAGIAGILPVNVGDYVTSQTTIVTIDDRFELLVDFWVPERFAGAVQVGADLTAASVARPDQTFQGKVSAVDNRIDAASRTLQVQAQIANPDDMLRAGMAFEVAMQFPGDAFPAVNPLALQWSAEGAYVWAVVDGRAQRKPVRIIQRNTDTVLVEAELPEGQMVVTEGVQSVRPDAEIQIANQQSPAPVAQNDVGAPAQ